MKIFKLLLISLALVLPLSAENSMKTSDLRQANKPIETDKVDLSSTLPESYDENRIKVTEKFGTVIPKEVEFYNHRGEKKPLNEYIDGKNVIVLNLVYFNCPSICNEVLNSLTEAAQKLPWKMGDNFKMLTVSIDPREKYPLAYRKRHSYIEYYGKPVEHKDWIFLTGQKEEIQVLADQVGFGFEYQEESGEYAHPAVTILLSPDGKVMRYLEGLVITPLNLKLGIIESGQGKVGNPIDRALLKYCYAYDPKSRGYSLMAKRVMTGGGAVTLALVAIMMFFLWRKEVRSGAIK